MKSGKLAVGTIAVALVLFSLLALTGDGLPPAGAFIRPSLAGAATLMTARTSGPLTR